MVAPPMSAQARTVICREGWYFIGLLGVVFGWALLREENLLLILSGMMLGALWLNRRLVAKTLTGLSVRRQAPNAIHAGQQLTVCLEILNSRPKGGSWAVQVRDLVRRIDTPPDQSAPTEMSVPIPSPTTSQNGVFYISLPAGHSERQIYRTTMPRRGLFEIGPARLSTRFPFGMFRRTATAQSRSRIVVFPRLGKLKEAWRFQHKPGYEGIHGSRKPGRAPGDFFGVRPWQPGDAIRWIHWRSSARRGNLVVRQFERPRRHDVALLVDLWYPRNPHANDMDHVEQAVSFAATLAADLCKRREGVLMVGVAALRPSWLHGDASPALMHGVLEQLALASACDQDQLAELCEANLNRLQSASEIVVVTSRPQLSHDLTSMQRSKFSDGQMEQSVRTISSAAPDFRDYFQEST